MAMKQDELALVVGISASLALSVITWLLGRDLAGVHHEPDRGAAWYYWKLSEPTFYTRLSAWSLYACHQLLHLAMVYYGQGRLKYSHSLRPFHYWMATMNFIFILLHLVQTHTTYDSLAQDTHILSALGSVAVMLIWVLLMENYKRGIFFGHPFPFSHDLIKFARKYHGYYFSWAIIYNFWYHPMEGTLPHISGLFYKFLLLVQSCLFMTPIHYNKYWTLTLEVAVLVHGTVVALITIPEVWTMFFFGFAMIFIITQMHGLRLSRTIKAIITLTVITGAAVVYSQKGWYHINELLRIPLIDYIGVFLLAGILWCVKKTFSVLQSNV